MKVKALSLALLAAALLATGCKTTSSTSSSSGSGLPSAGGGTSSGGMPAGSMPGGSPPGGGSSGTSSGSSSSSDTSSSSGSGSGEGGKSVEVLDGELDESLEDFDGRVSGAGADSGAIDILDPSGRNTGGISAGVPVFEDAEIGSGDVENAEIEERANEGYEGAEGEGDTMASAAGAAGAENIPVPDDVGDAQGDDIVLRQIREAAMKEPDPVLREKLWDEYRRIKGQ